MSRISLVLAMVCVAANAQEALVLEVGRAHLGTGVTLEKTRILLVDGRIQAMGADVAVPTGVRVLSFPTGEAIPGLVDFVSHAPLPRGDSQNEERSEITPSVRVSVMLDRTAPAFARLPSVGVTTVGVHPGLRNVIGGLLAAVKPNGDGPAIVLREDLGLLVTLGVDAARGNQGRGGIGLMTRLPNSRMGVVFLARKAFQDARNRQAQRAREPDSLPPPDADERVMNDALEGRLPVYWMAREQKDLEAAMEIAREFALPRNVAFDCGEAHRCTAALRSAGWPIVAAPQALVHRDSTRKFEIDGAARVARAQIPVAFGHGSTAAGATLRDSVLSAVRAGFPVESALRSVTLEPATLLGVADRVGSLEVGKDADVVVTLGPWLSPASPIVLVIVGGKIVHREMESGS